MYIHTYSPNPKLNATPTQSLIYIYIQFQKLPHSILTFTHSFIHSSCPSNVARSVVANFLAETLFAKSKSSSENVRSLVSGRRNKAQTKTTKARPPQKKPGEESKLLVVCGSSCVCVFRRKNASMGKKGNGMIRTTIPRKIPRRRIDKVRLQHARHDVHDVVRVARYANRLLP